MLELIWGAALLALLLLVAWGVWNSKTVDVVKPRRLRRTWTAEDQTAYEVLVEVHRGEA